MKAAVCLGVSSVNIFDKNHLENEARVSLSEYRHNDEPGRGELGHNHKMQILGRSQHTYANWKINICDGKALFGVYDPQLQTMAHWKGPLFAESKDGFEKIRSKEQS